MAKNIDFVSNTMKEPHRIAGTDLYYFQTTIGVSKNGYDRYIDYLQSKINTTSVNPTQEEMDSLSEIKETFRQDPLRHEELYSALLEQVKNKKAKLSKDTIKVSREYAWEIYHKPAQMEYNEFVESIKAGKIAKVGNLTFSPLNQNLKLDENGNLLLKTSGADLEDNNMGGGDVLVSGESGKVLKNTKGSMYIKPCDEFGNYPVDVFVGKKNKDTGNVEIVEIAHNYLDKDGHLFTKDNFKKSNEPLMYNISHTYQDGDGDSKFHESKYMYPTCYVITDRDGIKLYPSATALLIAHRSAVLKNVEAGIVGDEREFLENHYKRYDDINLARKKLQKNFDDGKIPSQIYINAMRTLDDELSFMRIFTEDFETSEDLQVQKDVENDNLDYFVDKI